MSMGVMSVAVMIMINGGKINSHINGGNMNGHDNGGHLMVMSVVWEMSVVVVVIGIVSNRKYF